MPPNEAIALPIPEAVRAAEASVIGSMLRDNDCIADVLPIVGKDDFATYTGQKIFAAIVSLWDAGKPADMVTVAELLIRLEQYEHNPHGVSDAVALAELWDAAPTAANAIYYARLVRDRSILRRLADAGGRIHRSAAFPSEEAECVLEEAERLIFSIAELGAEGQTFALRDLVFAALNHFDTAAQRGGGVTGLPTGFLDLDELTAGLHPGELVILAARPSCGKTALGLAIARNAMRRLPVFFASLEQSRLELAMRLLCSEARVNSHRIRKGCLAADDAERLAGAVEALREGTMHIDDAPHQSLLRIAANARRLKRRHGIALVVVDYLQLIEPENRRDPRHEQVGKISRRLKGLARELGVPVLALAQLNRAVEDRAGQRPRLSDLRESGSIEADADTVILLHHPQGTEPNQQHSAIIELHIAKQRNGPTGEVTLAYRRECMRFENHTTGTPFD